MFEPDKFGGVGRKKARLARAPPSTRPPAALCLSAPVINTGKGAAIIAPYGFLRPHAISRRLAAAQRTLLARGCSGRLNTSLLSSALTNV